MMSDEEDRHLAIHLEQVSAAADDGSDHSRYQEPYSRQAYRPDDTSFYVRAARYQETSPFMLPEASTMLPTHQEEDEEDILDDNDDDDDDEDVEYDDDDDDDDNEIDDDNGGGESDLVDLANRAFIATCQKFARQNYPEFRRRAPYSFLENWHLHSMYSKSQQILLGIPHAQPVVLLSGDDFMFTPQLVQQQHYDRMEFDWNDDDSAMDDDEDVLLVTARAPEDFMDENAWMSNRHSPPPFEDQLQEMPPQPQLSQPPDEQEDIDHDNNKSCSIDDHDSSDEGKCLPAHTQEGFTLSPEIVHWYRSAQYRPLTYVETREEEEQQQQQQEENNSDLGVPHVDTYQSLADMLPLPPPSSSSSSTPVQVTTQDIVITMPILEDYGSVRQMQQHQQHQQQQLRANALEDNDYRIFYYFNLGHASKRLADTAETIVELIDNFDRSKTGFFRFVILMFYIWRILFLCMESMLADLGSSFIPSTRRHQVLSSRKASLTH